MNFIDDMVDSYINDFRKLDTDGDASLSSKEIVEAFKKNGIDLSNQEAINLIARYDKDGDGKISLRGKSGLFLKIKITINWLYFWLNKRIPWCVVT